MLARVARDSAGEPAIIQSSAAVHSGSSGGALVCAKCKSLLGLVATNVRVVRPNGEMLLPHVNFSLPTTKLVKMIPVLGRGRCDGVLEPDVDARAYIFSQFEIN